MLVPWESSVRAPGLTIHVRRGEVYHERAPTGPTSGGGSGSGSACTPCFRHAPILNSDGLLEGDAHAASINQEMT